VNIVTEKSFGSFLQKRIKKSNRKQFKPTKEPKHSAGMVWLFCRNSSVNRIF